MSPEISDNGRTGDLTVTAITIKWDGVTRKLDASGVIKAFERAGFGDFSGPHARYVLEIGGELKTTKAVFSEIVQTGQEEITFETSRQIADLFESLGFVVLDREKHHGK